MQLNVKKDIQVKVKKDMWLNIKNKRLCKNTLGCYDVNCLDNDLINCNECIFYTRLRISEKELKERGLIKYENS